MRVRLIIIMGFALAFIHTSSNIVKAQEIQDIEAMIQRIDSLRDSKSVFRFGLSLGPRIIAFEESDILQRRNASISPSDSTLKFENVDRFEIVLAGVVSAYPFNKSENKFIGIPIKRIGFSAKLNLAEFAPNSFTVNKVIEGGVGFSYSLSREFAVGFGIERVRGNRIRSSFKKDQKIYSEGELLLSLDPTNDKLFVDDNYTSLSISWIYGF